MALALRTNLFRRRTWNLDQVRNEDAKGNPGAPAGAAIAAGARAVTPAATSPARTLAGALHGRTRHASETGTALRARMLQAKLESEEAAAGKVKPIDLEGVKSGRVTPSGRELVDHVNALRKEQGRDPIPAEDAKVFDELSAQERRFYAATLHELDRIVLDKDEGAARDYMTNVMQHAADISGGDREVFVNLTHKAFSSPVAEGYNQGGEYGRRAAGGGASITGQYLEGIYSRSGFKGSDTNPLAVDSADPNGSDVPHHFGEFLSSGYHGSKIPLLDAWGLVTKQDSPDENPGDVRNGFFGVMVGEALKEGKITPQAATDLTRWAYARDHGGTRPPPWGSTAEDVERDNGNWSDKGPRGIFGRDYHGYLHQARYDIDDWMNAYRDAHP